MDTDYTMLPQKDVLSLTGDDILIGSCPDHLSLWEEWLDHYLLKGIETALNKVPIDNQISKMSEEEFNKWLSTKEFEKDEAKRVTIDLPNDEKLIKGTASIKATQTYILSLSLENNSTLAGTASILKEFANIVNIDCNEKTEYLPYDKKLKCFSIKKAKEHHESLRILHQHNDDMADFEKLLTDTEKSVDGRTSISQNADDEGGTAFEFDTLEVEELIDGINLSDETEQESSQSDGAVAMSLPVDTEIPEQVHVYPPGHDVPTTILKGQQKIFKEEDQKFGKIYNSLQFQFQKMYHQCKLGELIQTLRGEAVKYQLRDHFGRAILHVAVEQNNCSLVKVILSMGFDPNVKEHCGATPLVLAVVNKYQDTCAFLVDAGASVRGPLFERISCPLDIALSMEAAEIIKI